MQVRRLRHQIPGPNIRQPPQWRKLASSVRARCAETLSLANKVLAGGTGDGPSTSRRPGSLSYMSSGLSSPDIFGASPRVIAALSVWARVSRGRMAMAASNRASASSVLPARANRPPRAHSAA